MLEEWKKINEWSVILRFPFWKPARSSASQAFHENIQNKYVRLPRGPEAFPHELNKRQQWSLGRRCRDCKNGSYSWNSLKKTKQDFQFSWVEIVQKRNNPLQNVMLQWIYCTKRKINITLGLTWNQRKVWRWQSAIFNNGLITLVIVHEKPTKAHSSRDFAEFLKLFSTSSSIRCHERSCLSKLRDRKI